MNFLGPLIFFALTGLWFGLCLIPSLSEWRRPSDANPLRLDYSNDGDIRHFQRTFRHYLNFYLREDSPQSGQFPDGTHYRIVPDNGAAPLAPSEERRRLARTLLIFNEPANLSHEITFTRGVYGKKSLACGERNVFRSVLGDEDIELGKGCLVYRWLHAGGSLFAEQECKLYGRASADTAMRLSENSVFQRLNAPVIDFGEPEVDPANIDEPEFTPAGRLMETVTQRWVISGLMEMPSGIVTTGNVISAEDMLIRANAHIVGSIKSSGSIVVEEGAVIEGSIVASKHLQINSGCRIAGPVIAERDLIIYSGCRIGTRKHPTTVSAERIFIKSGTRAHGTVWARNYGEVIHEQNDPAIA